MKIVDDILEVLFDRKPAKKISESDASEHFVPKQIELERNISSQKFPEQIIPRQYTSEDDEKNTQEETQEDCSEEIANVLGNYKDLFVESGRDMSKGFSWGVSSFSGDCVKAFFVVDAKGSGNKEFLEKISERFNGINIIGKRQNIVSDENAISLFVEIPDKEKALEALKEAYLEDVKEYAAALLVEQFLAAKKEITALLGEEEGAVVFKEVLETMKNYHLNDESSDIDAQKIFENTQRKSVNQASLITSPAASIWDTYSKIRATVLDEKIHAPKIVFRQDGDDVVAIDTVRFVWKKQEETPEDNFQEFLEGNFGELEDKDRAESVEVTCSALEYWEHKRRRKHKHSSDKTDGYAEFTVCVTVPNDRESAISFRKGLYEIVGKKYVGGLVLLSGDSNIQGTLDHAYEAAKERVSNLLDEQDDSENLSREALSIAITRASPLQVVALG